MQVASGPFSGMRYLDQSFASVLEPKLLGIYEQELHQTIEEAVRMEFSKVVDIGAAEGYYAVGLAMRLPRAGVWAFEAEEAGRAMLRQLVEINNVSDRVTIKGRCLTSDLAGLIRGGERILIVCDVEGAEEILLDPEVVPGLRQAHMLVELHAKSVPGIGELLARRFADTHHIQTVLQEVRTAADYPYQSFPVNWFPLVYVEKAVSEFRQPWEDRMSWLWMKPR